LFIFFWAYSDDYDTLVDETVVQDTIRTRDAEMDMDRDSTTLYTGKYGTVVTEKAISNYLTYINNSKMGLEHEYTNGALIHLITATEAEANNLGVDISANLEKSA